MMENAVDAAFDPLWLVVATLAAQGVGGDQGIGNGGGRQGGRQQVELGTAQS